MCESILSIDLTYYFQLDINTPINENFYLESEKCNI
jgi:hypothetical protein